MKPCLGNLEVNCDRDHCVDYLECLKKYNEMEIRASEHRRD